MSTNTNLSPLEFELVSGLEIHVQLNTKSKIFSSDSASFGAQPNEHISEVSLALPGALPKLNKEVIAKAIRIGLALNCEINQLNYFDRKNYFYADLPKGYQITQDNQPICKKGFIDLSLSSGEVKRIGINRIHLEEDAGKSLHDQDENYSFVDLNRAGVPLIEIVTEPDISSAEEASVLLTEIRKLVRHLNVSDGNMEEGSLRCDANISIRKPQTAEFGTRCEVKNLNSIRNVRRAMEFEFRRQVELVSNGGTVVQSTLNFDADQGTTSPMRTKEMANDYRYFPDPDLSPIFISDEWLQEIRNQMPLLPKEITDNLVAQLGIHRSEAVVLSEDPDLMIYLGAALPKVQNHKTLVNWLLGPIRSLLNERNLHIVDYKVSPEQMAAVINLVEAKKLTQHIAIQQLLPALEVANEIDLAHEAKTAKEAVNATETVTATETNTAVKANTAMEADVFVLAEKLNLLIEEDGDELGGFIDTVLQKFQPQVIAYKKGKKGVMGLFVGEVIKLAKGKADPQKVNALLQEKLK